MPLGHQQGRAAGGWRRPGKGRSGETHSRLALNWGGGAGDRGWASTRNQQQAERKRLTPPSLEIPFLPKARGQFETTCWSGGLRARHFLRIYQNSKSRRSMCVIEGTLIRKGEKAQIGQGLQVSEPLFVPPTHPGACLVHWQACHTTHQYD